MEEEHPGQQAIDPLVDAARRAAWAEVEAHWLERVEAKPPSPGAFVEAARLLAEAGERDRVGILVAMAAPPLLAAGEAAAVLDLLRAAVSVQAEEGDLTEFALQACRKAFARNQECDALLKRADLERGEGLRHIMGLLDAFFRFDVGDLALHSGGWGTGEVKKIVPRREELHVLFESGRSHVFPLRTAGDYLVPIPPERLDAMLRKCVDRLREEAGKDPLRLVARALEFRGGALDGRELKSLLVPAVFEEARWSDWWGGVRLQLKKAPAFDIGGGPNPLISRRAVPVSPLEGIRLEFHREPAFWDRLRLLRSYVKSMAPAETDAGFVSEALGVLARDARAPAEKTGVAYLVEDARKVAPSFACPAPEFPAPADLAPYLRAVPVSEYKSRILEEARRRWPEAWPQAFTGLLFVDDPEAWEPAVQALLKAGRSDLVAGRIPELLASPGKNPWAFLWLAKNALQGHLAGLPGLPGPTAFVDLLLGVVHGARTDRICEGAEAKKVAGRARALLTESALHRAFEGVTDAEAKSLWHRVRTVGLSPTVLMRAESVVSELYPDLIGEPSAADDAQKKEDILWTTSGGLRRRQQEYDQLMNVEIPQNRVDLGEALERGDISENAELNAAREKQQELERRTNLIRAELDRARVIDPAAVSPDVAGIGTEVQIAEKGREERSYTLLGPWDTDLDKGWISYLSPIGQALIGRKVGEHVPVQTPDGVREMEVKGVRRSPQIEPPVEPGPGAAS